MRLHIFFVLLIVILSLNITACAKGSPDSSFKASESDPLVDGILKEGEYGYSQEITAVGITVSLSRNKDKAWIGLESASTGWIAIGFNSTVMNDAHILIGYVTDGAVHFKEQVGVDHRHVDPKNNVLTKYGMSEKDGKTTLEAELPLTALMNPGQTSLNLIVAIGSPDDFASRHTFRKSLSVKVE
ncbi:MAG: hypothetical protein JW969_06930 [Spirochaetales bacterium]|nr:hypothetical protein [Spirochaetales bacterium]